MDKKELKLLIELGEKPITLPPHIAKKFLKRGWIDEVLDITAEGIEMIERIQDRLIDMKNGVLFSSRKKVNTEKILETDIAWFTAKMDRKPIFTDRTVIAFGKPPEEMKSERGSPEMRMKIPAIYSRIANLKHVKVAPMWYQTDGKLFPEDELVWMSDEEGLNCTALQAYYVDYFQARYPGGRWEYSPEADMLRMVSRSKGVTPNHILVLANPVILPENWKIPGSDLI